MLGSESQGLILKGACWGPGAPSRKEWCRLRAEKHELPARETWLADE